MTGWLISPDSELEACMVYVLSLIGGIIHKFAHCPFWPFEPVLIFWVSKCSLISILVMNICFRGKDYASWKPCNCVDSLYWLFALLLREELVGLNSLVNISSLLWTKILTGVESWPQTHILALSFSIWLIPRRSQATLQMYNLICILLKFVIL